MFFFFFQAEDGIRDHCVTGVQTCALPISSEAFPVCAPRRAAHTRSRAVVSLKSAMRPFHTRHAGCPDEGPEQWDWLAARQTPDVDRAADSARRARDRGARSAAR